jgi:undecaprenyl diphosphate synthase
VIGRDEPIPKYLQSKIKEVQEKSKDNTGLKVVLALNYGSRQEIVDAVRKFTDAVIKGEVRLKDLDERTFSNYFYTAGLPDPDLLIRTSGEMRLSNFLLWQLSYAELYFSHKYWPDFSRKDLEKAISEYQKRERRFGGVNAT